MRNEFFQELFDLLIETLPEQWNKVVYFAGYTLGSYVMKYYVQQEQGLFKDCFEIGNLNDTQILQLFIALDKIVSAERNTLSENERWNVITISVDSMGSMKAEFDYCEVDEDMIEYEEEWKEKYLV